MINEDFRYIPSLLLYNGELYKTTKFKSPKYVGDPINTIKIFNDKNVDELIVLNIDRGKEIDYEVLENMASEAFFPLSYGGGVKSVQQAREIFRLGFEKIVINTEFLSRPEFLKELIEIFGAQSIVVSLDFHKNIFGNYKLFNKSLKKLSSLDDYLLSLQNNPPAEIVVTSVNNEGTYGGYDLKLLESINFSKINSKILINGGCSGYDEMRSLEKCELVDSVVAGNIFIYKRPHNAVLINYIEK